MVSDHKLFFDGANDRYCDDARLVLRPCDAEGTDPAQWFHFEQVEQVGVGGAGGSSSGSGSGSRSNAGLLSTNVTSIVVTSKM